MSRPANLWLDHGIQRMTVNWVHENPGLACSMCDNYQQAINKRAAPRFLLQPMQYSHVSISKIDNGETKTRTRINFDNRLLDNRLSFNIPSCHQDAAIVRVHCLVECITVPRVCTANPQTKLELWVCMYAAILYTHHSSSSLQSHSWQRLLHHSSTTANYFPRTVEGRVTCAGHASRLYVAVVFHDKHTLQLSTLECYPRISCTVWPRRTQWGHVVCSKQ